MEALKSFIWKSEVNNDQNLMELIQTLFGK